MLRRRDAEKEEGEEISDTDEAGEGEIRKAFGGRRGRLGGWEGCGRGRIGGIRRQVFAI